MVGLNEAKSRLNEAEKEKVEEEVDLLAEDMSFTQEQFNEVWEEFAKMLKESGREGDFAIMKQEYSLTGTDIDLTLPNSFQLLTLERLQQELLTFLRQRLQNRKIQLNAEVKANSEVKMVYTNKEKFDYLAEKYPQLLELKRRLDLETDF